MNKKQKFSLDEAAKKCKNLNDLMGKNGLIQNFLGQTIERLLEEEMNEHLGYEKHAVEGYHSGNSRNGKTPKRLQSNFGPLDIEVPRERKGNFSPKIVKKGQRSVSCFDEKIISMYAKGMTTRDIQSHIKEIYGADISPTQVSMITEKVLILVEDWQSRPLSSVYPVVFFDALHYKVKEDGRVISKAAYTCLGIDQEGKKDILGLWIGESEGAKFWLSVISELKNRGVQDIFIACIDGLKGLPEAIKEVFPQVDIQLCVIHQIRNSIKYIPHKFSKSFMSDLKQVYKASSLSQAESALITLQENWESKYPLSVRSWVDNWEHIKTFFQFPDEIRRLIYTTNAVESLHRQFRKVTKNRSVFPSDEALIKLLFLSAKDISKKWTSAVRSWKEAISHFSLVYGERLKIGVYS